MAHNKIRMGLRNDNDSDNDNLFSCHPHWGIGEVYNQFEFVNLTLKYTIQIALMLIDPPPPKKKKKKKKIFYVGMPRTIMHGPTEDFFMLGTGGKCNELLKIYCIFILFFHCLSNGLVAVSPQDQNRVDVLYKCPFMRHYSPFLSVMT